MIATALAQTTAGGKACTQANTDEIQKCADTYTKCAQDNATVDGVCTCLGEYKSCADKISCDGPVAKGIRDGLSMTCKQYEMTANRDCCSSASGLVASLTAVLALAAARLF